MGAATTGLLVEGRGAGRFTFALNHALHGFDVRGFHLVNLAIHLLTAWCVYRLVLVAFRAVRDGALEDEGGDRLAALTAALLFVAHPVQTQAVTYVVQRYASLAALFYVASLLLYATSRLDRTRRRSALLYAGSIFSAVLAMRTKEIAFTLPFAIVLWELLFVKAKRAERARWLALPLVTLAIIPAILLLGAASSDGGKSAELTRGGNVDRLEYLLTQFRVVVTYLRLLVLPIGQNVDPDVPIHRSLDLEVALSAVLLAGLLGAGAWLAVTGRRRAHPHMLVAGFGVVFFFLAISVESSVIPITDLMQEHRVYLPSVGAFMAAGAGVAALRERSRSPLAPRLFPAAVAVVGLALAAATWARNAVWSSPVSLWRDAAEKSPNKLRPLLNLANALEESGQAEAARRVSIRALGMSPSHPDEGYALGMVYRSIGDIEAARRVWEAALEWNPRHARSLLALGDLAWELADPAGARDHFERAVQSDPSLAVAHLKLAIVLERSGEVERALSHYEAFTRTAPPALAGDAAQVQRMLDQRRAGIVR
jgi:tetratricopeptide (TPR) repeat protein